MEYQAQYRLITPFSLAGLHFGIDRDLNICTFAVGEPLYVGLRVSVVSLFLYLGCSPTSMYLGIRGQLDFAISHDQDTSRCLDFLGTKMAGQRRARSWPWQHVMDEGAILGEIVYDAGDGTGS